jgi:RNA polymerase sigma-70 factor (ECF subfamily)
MNEEALQTEATLIERILSGEKSAFEELFHAERARLHRVAYQIMRDHCDAEEIVQDAFTRAYRKLSSFRRQCSLRTWLHAIVINTARNRYAYFRRRFRHATEGLGEAMAVFTTDPAMGAAGRELATNLPKWVEDLPPNYREVIIARVLHDKSYEEIAKEIEISVGTVKSRLSRGRRCLRRRWETASGIQPSIP